MNTNDKSMILGILNNVVSMLGKIIAVDERPAMVEEPAPTPDIAVNGIDRLTAILAGNDVPPEDDVDEDLIDGLPRKPVDISSRASEVNALGSLWINDDDMEEMRIASAHFNKEPSHRHHERVASNVEEIQMVSIEPASDMAEAKELVASGKYKWVFKSAHDNSNDTRSGMMLVPRENAKVATVSPPISTSSIVPDTAVKMPTISGDEIDTKVPSDYYVPVNAATDVKVHDPMKLPTKKTRKRGTGIPRGYMGN